MGKKYEVEEAEVINPGGKNQINTKYRAQYTQFNEETRKVSPFVFTISLIAFFLSLIPILGVCLAIIAMIFAKIKHTSMILAAVAFVIGCVSTTIFLLVAMVFRWLF